jgi:endoglycosylceramidase
VILDEQDRPVRLLSMNAGSLASGSGYPDAAEQRHTGCRGYITPPLGAAANIAAWGFNSVRLPIAWAVLEPTPPTRLSDGRLRHHYNMAYVRTVDQTIDRFRESGIAVILDMHQVYWSPAFKNLPIYGGAHLCQGGGFPAWMYKSTSSKWAVRTAETQFFANRHGVQRGFVDAWTFFARRYRDDPAVVGADMLNEPVTHHLFSPSKLHLTEFYERVGSAIEAVNPHLLLIFEDNNYLGDSPKDFGITGRPSLHNGVYSFHTYVDTWAIAHQETSAFLRRARGWNVPAWNGEWDMFRASSPNPTHTDWQRAVDSFMRYYRANDIGWTIYADTLGWFLGPNGDPKPGLLAAARSGF